MSSNVEQNLPNLRLLINENRIYEVTHRFEDQADGSRKVVRSILRKIDDRQVTTIQIIDENNGNILELEDITDMSDEEMEDFMDDWNEVCENLREFDPSLHSVLNRFASLDF